MFDLSHRLEHGTVTLPSFPTPVMEHHITFDQSRAEIADGREFAIDHISFIGGSATYIDAPRHMDRDGTDIAALNLAQLIDRPVVVIPPPAVGRAYRRADVARFQVDGAAVLLATGWDQHWGTPQYLTGSPFLEGDAAAALAAAGAAMVGIDAVLIDDIDDPSPRPRRDAHITLLRAGIPIIENLRGLTNLPGTPLTFSAVPAPVRGVGSFPVRAYARPTSDDSAPAGVGAPTR